MKNQTESSLIECPLCNLEIAPRDRRVVEYQGKKLHQHCFLAHCQKYPHIREFAKPMSYRPPNSEPRRQIPRGRGREKKHLFPLTQFDFICLFVILNSPQLDSLRGSLIPQKPVFGSLPPARFTLESTSGAGRGIMIINSADQISCLPTAGRSAVGGFFIHS